MASITYSYRSRKDRSFVQARLLYYAPDTDKRLSLYVPTKVQVAKLFWTEYRKVKNFRDIEKANLKKSIDDHLFNLTAHVLNEFDKVSLAAIDKDWLKGTVHDYYHPQSARLVPETLLGYWEYYMNLRKHELQERIRSWQKWNTVKHKVQRFQKARERTFSIKDVDEQFVRDWVEYCQSENYSNATIKKEFSYIKTVCVHARSKGIEASGELDILKIKLKTPTTPKVYLSFSELEKIKEVKDLPEYLDNARDWLLISSYSGQRVSDFMRFDKSMIRKQQGAMFLDIRQVKTGKDVTIPLIPEVIEILHKRGGQFPRPISPQRYNDWIKVVAKKAGLKKKIKGGIRIDNRLVPGEYPKWKTVASHIGRRSFATNYYGKIPTSYLKDITGHGTEQMLLAYIGKTSKDTAFEAYELMLNTR
jgi:site-specific recombinase XerD